MEERDHKKLGPELELFYIDQTIGKGLPVYLPKGAIVKRELEKFVIEEETKRGYLHVSTPDLARLELYEKSGHYPHYKDSMYAPIVVDDERFMLRPMTCPHHFQMYLSRPHSYRELPMRIAELAQLYRYEQSGELMGLIRTRNFCLADAHIICADEEQAAAEVAGALDLIEHMNGVFGLKLGVDYRFRLSLGDRTNTEKYYKNDAAWEKAEDLLRRVMQQRLAHRTTAEGGAEFEEAKDEAAFYGPKIDVQMKNANGKEDTAFTVQYDFCMPDRFDLTYVGEDGQPHRAFVVHRSSIGSVGRTMAFLIEKYGGAFPTWLAPVQARVLSVSEAHAAYANTVVQELKDAGIRAEADTNNESLGKKIREAKGQKIPYLLVVGDAEVAAGTASLESRTGKEGAPTIAEVISKLQKEIKERA